MQGEGCPAAALKRMGAAKRIMIGVFRMARFGGAWLLAAMLALTAGAARAQDNAIPVDVAAAETRAIENVVRLSGTVVAPRSARLSTSVGGIVERIDVDIGDRVAPGDRLVELDRELAAHEVARAEAALDEAEADLADAQRRVRVAQRLVERDNLPQNELDAREAEVQAAAAAVQRLTAEAAREREYLARRQITAPFAGVIAHKETELGEWIAPGSTLVELVAVGDLRVDIPVPQKYYPQVAAETPVTLRFDALPEKSFAARRVALVPVSDPTARTFTLRVQPKAAEIPLTPGMSARAILRLTTGESGVTIPRDAVIRYPDGRTTVWVAEAESAPPKAREKQVQLGRAFDGLVHVRSGLKAGARVVVRGNESLREGQPLRIADGSD